MGEIALSPGREAVTLFRQVLLASVSIPVAFPPVRIQVEAGGKVRDELHVDGGTTQGVHSATADVPALARAILLSTASTPVLHHRKYQIGA